MRALLRFLAAWVRFLVAIALVVIGALLIQQSFWFRKNVDSWMRTPFVVAAIGVGIFAAASGLRTIYRR